MIQKVEMYKAVCDKAREISAIVGRGGRQALLPRLRGVRRRNEELQT